MPLTERSGAIESGASEVARGLEQESFGERTYGAAGGEPPIPAKKLKRYIWEHLRATPPRIEATIELINKTATHSPNEMPLHDLGAGHVIFANEKFMQLRERMTVPFIEEHVQPRFNPANSPKRKIGILCLIVDERLTTGRAVSIDSIRETSGYQDGAIRAAVNELRTNVLRESEWCVEQTGRDCWRLEHRERLAQRSQ